MVAPPGQQKAHPPVMLQLVAMVTVRTDVLMEAETAIFFPVVPLAEECQSKKKLKGWVMWWQAGLVLEPI